MTETRRITVTLPKPLADAVQTAVESGGYATTSEVVRDAVALWQEHAAAREIGALRKAWNDGKASGDPRPFTIDAILSRAGTELKKRKRA